MGINYHVFYLVYKITPEQFLHFLCGPPKPLDSLTLFISASSDNTATCGIIFD